MSFKMSALAVVDELEQQVEFEPVLTLIDKTVLPHPFTESCSLSETIHILGRITVSF